MTNIQPANEGIYDCAITDDFNVTNSQPATLALVSRPLFVQNPLTNSAVVGGSATFTAAVTNSSPGRFLDSLSFRWRKGGATVVPGAFSGFIISNAAYSCLVLTNVQPADAVDYSVAVTNIVGGAIGGSQTGLSAKVPLTVLADSDHDGIADDWETNSALHPCLTFDPNNSADGALDSDGDGMSNAAEYAAGTDPCDPNSKLAAILTGPDARTIQFNAVANHAYSIQFSDTLNPVQWRKLADILAKDSNHTESIVDSSPRTNRFYRVVTPAQQ